MITEWQIRREIVETARKVYDAGFVVATDGNISVRVMGDRLFLTPSGSCMKTLNPADLVYVDFDGRVLSGGRPSSELPLHLTVYRQRPDVNAVIHSHPPLAVGCSVAGVSLEPPVVPEAVMSLGRIPTAEYATLSSEESAASIRELIRAHDAVVMDRHGAVTVGKTLADAFRRLEKVEYTARVTLAATQLGQVRTLTPEQMEKLNAVAARLGIQRSGY